MDYRPYTAAHVVTQYQLLLFSAVVIAMTASAEQKMRLGPYDVHYVVLPSTFFDAEVAQRYGIVRGRDRAMMNLSILADGQTPVAVKIAGHMTNLLSQRYELEFREVKEGTAVYYLAEVKHTDRETLRFNVQITTPDGQTRELKFQQQMFWDDR